MMAGDRVSPVGQDNRDWICVGVVSGAHGIRGEVRLKSFTADPGDIASYERLYAGPDGDPVRLISVRPQKGQLTARIEGVDDRNTAEALKGTKFYVLRSDLPKPSGDEFYVSDMAGLVAVDKAGQRLGVIESADDYGAGPLLELKLDEPRRLFGCAPVVPFTKAIVPDVDLASGVVTVLLDEWLDGQVEPEPNEEKDGGAS